jgi:hypothetical protein
MLSCTHCEYQIIAYFDSSLNTFVSQTKEKPLIDFRRQVYLLEPIAFRFRRRSLGPSESGLKVG